MRPSWDDWYMFMAFWISRRSPDPSTKHGCVIVDRKHRPLSLGYNGCPEGCDDAAILSERPLKYYGVIHSEENGLLNCDRDVDGATIYVTGMPCSRCWAKIIQSGIKRVVYGPTNSACIDETDERARGMLLKNHPEIQICEWQADIDVTACLHTNMDEIFNILKDGCNVR